MHSRLVAGCLALVILAGVSGCSSSGGKSSAPTVTGPETVDVNPNAPLTKNKFIAQADAICRHFADLRSNADSLPAKPTDAQIKKFVQSVVLPTYRNEVDALRQLKPPTADAKKITQIWDDLAKGINQLAATVAKNPKQVIQSPPASMTKAAKAAQAYGFTNCGASAG